MQKTDHEFLKNLAEEDKTSLLKLIQYIQTQKDKIKIVSDLAFDAVDLDESKSLDQDELNIIIREVAKEMRVKPPTDNDIESILQELDEDGSNEIDKEEFVKLINLVFEQMLGNEVELIKSIKDKKDNQNKIYIKNIHNLFSRNNLANI